MRWVPRSIPSLCSPGFRSGGCCRPTDHFFADQRFVAHSLDELTAVAGIASVDAVIPSHYHDDHLAGVPWLQVTHGTQAWIHETFADIVSRPDNGQRAEALVDVLLESGSGQPTR